VEIYELFAVGALHAVLYFEIYYANNEIVIMLSGGSWSLEPEGREPFSRQAPLGSLG
jgi:hypothetical protein